jgi:hypothetical protein
MTDILRNKRMTQPYARKLWIGLFLILLAVPSAHAQRREPQQQTYLNQQRQLEESIRLQLDRDLPATQKVLLDWGGWLSNYLMLFDDGTKDRTLRRYDFRLWGSLNADDGIHQGYARMRMNYDDFNHGDGFVLAQGLRPVKLDAGALSEPSAAGFGDQLCHVVCREYHNRNDDNGLEIIPKIQSSALQKISVRP